MIRPALLALSLLAGLTGPAAAQSQQPPIPVLTYHRFDPVVAKATTVVTDARFAAQLEWLAAHHVAVVPLRDAVAAVTGGKTVGPAVVLTADDGWRTTYTDMFPILKRMNMPATLFINPAMIGGGRAYLTWPMLEEMVKSGLVDVQAHTQTHPNFVGERRRLGADAYAALLDREIAGSRAPITEHLNLPADMLAWPYGYHDATLEAEAAKAGYIAAFALGSRAMRPGDPIYALPRLQVYETDDEARFAAVVAGHARGMPQKISDNNGKPTQ